jgi:hypothetical protein
MQGFKLSAVAAKRRGADKKHNQDGVKRSRKKRRLDLDIAATVR